MPVEGTAFAVALLSEAIPSIQEQTVQPISPNDRFIRIGAPAPAQLPAPAPMAGHPPAPVAGHPPLLRRALPVAGNPPPPRPYPGPAAPGPNAVLHWRQVAFPVRLAFPGRGAAPAADGGALPERWPQADGGSPKSRFLRAVAAGDIHAAVMLMADGVAADNLTPQGRTALMVAVQNGHFRMVGLLLNNGADAKRLASNGNSLLHEAATAGNPGIMQLLLEHGGGPGHLDHRNDEGYTALNQAAFSGNQPIARLLLEHGADVDGPSEIGETPLLLAAREQKIDVATLLLAHDADRERSDNLGFTPLLEAAYSGSAGMVKLLLAAGADPCGAGPGNQDPPLCAAAKRGFVAVAQALLDAWPPRAGDARPARPGVLAAALSMAARQGHPEIVMLLLERGAQADLPMFLAAPAMNEACVDLVLVRLMPEPSLANPFALKDPGFLADAFRFMQFLCSCLIDAAGDPGEVRPILHRALCAKGVLSLNVKKLCFALGDVWSVWQMAAGPGRAVSMAQQTLCCASMLASLDSMAPAQYFYEKCGLKETGMRTLVPLAQRQADCLQVLGVERFDAFQEWLKDLVAYCQRFTGMDRELDREGLQAWLTGCGGMHLELAGLVADSWDRANEEAQVPAPVPARVPVHFARLLMEGMESADYRQVLRANRAALDNPRPYENFLEAVHARVRQHCLGLLGRRDG